MYIVVHAVADINKIILIIIVYCAALALWQKILSAKNTLLRTRIFCAKTKYLFLIITLTIITYYCFQIGFLATKNSFICISYCACTLCLQYPMLMSTMQSILPTLLYTIGALCTMQCIYKRHSQIIIFMNIA